MKLNILFEDEYIIVCHKNAGIAVETARIGEADMVSQLRNYRKDTMKNPYLGVVHRLDQPVEGVIVFAKSPVAAAKLSNQVSKNGMKKYYLAVICGQCKRKEGNLVDYLLKNGKTNTSSVVDKSVASAKRSELNYRILETVNDLSLAKIELLTGRHHQIRVQMANANMPLWGDVKYNKGFHSQRGVRIALCAYKLSFQHPKTNKVMTFQIEPTNEMFKRFNCE